MGAKYGRGEGGGGLSQLMLCQSFVENSMKMSETGPKRRAGWAGFRIPSPKFWKGDGDL